MRFEQKISVEQVNRKAIDILAEAVPTLSRQKLKQAMDKGAVWIKKGKGEQRLRRATKVVSPPQSLHIYYDDTLLAKQAPTPELIADLQHYSVWNKPAGLLSQGTPFGDHCSLLRVTEKYFQQTRQVFLVHRLDAEACGLMLIAHNRQAAAQLSDLFKRQQVIKRYCVQVEGVMEAGEINSPINGKAACTVIESVKHLDATISELLVQIKTGRKHQIRRHFSALGHPVIGDKKYDSARPEQALQLRAIEISFNCPLTKQAQQFQLPK